MRGEKQRISFFLLFIFIIPLAAAEQVVINSDDWRDVFAGMLYASITGSKGHFVFEKTQGIQLLQVLDASDKDIFYVKGKQPLISGMDSALSSRDFSVETYNAREEKTALDLARKASVTNFIIVDDIYGYNAISAAPYAVATKSFVLFANRDNINDVADVLSQVSIDKIIILGKVDAEVLEELDSLNPIIINHGNKFDDNLEIVERFLDINQVNQVSFTSGDRIEASLVDGAFPVLLVGSSRIPDKVMDFLKRNDNIAVGVFIGAEGAELARTIRKEVGIRVLIKFAKGITSGGSDQTLYALDTFLIPTHEGIVDIYDARYNLVTKQLEMVYENPTNVPVYALATTHDIFSNDELIISTGDEEEVFLDKKERKTVIYDVDLIAHADEDVKIRSHVIFGETPGALEKVLFKNTSVSFIEIEDDSLIQLKKIVYNKYKQQFEIDVENLKEDKVYVKPHIIDISIARSLEDLAGEQQIIEGTKTITVDALLTDRDLAKNKIIHIVLFYGSREDALIKTLKEDRELIVVTSGYIIYIIAGAVLFIFLFIWLAKRKK